MASNHEPRITITMERAGRLFRLFDVLSAGPCPRSTLMKRLKVGQRTFYRDLDLLRSHGIELHKHADGYALSMKHEEVLGLLPFPDPELTFLEVQDLMKGRKTCHAKLRKLFQQLTK